MAPVAAPTRGALESLIARRDLILPLAIVACVLVVLVPLPPALMDVLLAANITVSVIMLLTAISVRTPLEFSVFPSLLLVTTLARLVLNVATTRLILSNAPTDGLLAAGGVIKGFGQFVAGDRAIVGLVIFAILVVVQFVVITKGSGRISEVAARFALDGLPGKQMAIDADLNAGLIDQAEAQTRREALGRQADFYGAMDGASKFVRGDAIAGILITLINIVGGLALGVFESGMSLTEAGSVFTRLTIGDGLVSQVPALLIALAAGMLVTRSTAPSDLSRDVLSQLFARPQALAVTGGFLAVLLLTNLPTLPLLALGSSCVAMSVVLAKQPETKAEPETQQPAEEPTPIEEYLAVDPIEVEIGVGLIRLADPKRDGDLLDRIQRVRQTMAADIGIVLPKVRIRDNVVLGTQQYRIKLSDIPVAEGTVRPDRLLAIDTGKTSGKLRGPAVDEPAYGMPAVWIEPEQREEARQLGYTVVEPGSVVATHLTEVIGRHADELLSRDATHQLLERLKQSAPTVVSELVPGTLKLAEVQRVLQMLLREGVSIRHLAPILEALGEAAEATHDPDKLIQHVRRKLARHICGRLRDQRGRLYVVTLEPAVEERIAADAGLSHAALGRLAPESIETLCRRVSDELKKLAADGHPPVVVVRPHLRAAAWRLLSSRLARVHVLSYDEITPDTKVHDVALISDWKAVA